MTDAEEIRTGAPDPETPAPSLRDLIARIDQESEALPKPEAEPTVPPAAEEASHLTPYIRFLLADILLAIPLTSVLEIGATPPVTPLPNLPAWVLGVSNLRGEIVSMVDLRAFFGLEGSADPRRGATARRMTVLVHNPEMKVGLVVDRVMGLYHLDRAGANLQSPPYREGEPAHALLPFITEVIPPPAGPESRLLNLFDVSGLLSSPRMTAFTSE